MVSIARKLKYRNIERVEWVGDGGIEEGSDRTHVVRSKRSLLNNRDN